MFTFIRKILTFNKNIITIEEPVEYEIPGTVQCEVNAKQHLTFERLFIASLRQDPDVIVLGELREQKCAFILEQAVLSGHLLLSTMHATSTCHAVRRLRSFGLSLDFLAQNLLININQRLIRKLCLDCRLATGNTFAPFRANSNGCNSCNEGYCGQCAIFECFTHKQRFNYRQHAFMLLQDGITDEEEIVRVIGIGST